MRKVKPLSPVVKMMPGLTRIGVLLSLALHLLDQATDIFVATLFYFEGETWTAAFTLMMVFLPGLCVCVLEIQKICVYPTGSVFRALGYLLFSPLWALVIHLYSLYDERYLRSALFFKTLEGFVEAGPQLTFQLSLLLRGSFSQSSHMVLRPALQEIGASLPSVVPVGADSSDLTIFGRAYPSDDRYWFGVAHVFSMMISFLSILISSVVFNDLENPSDDFVGLSRGRRLVGKLLFGVPFFFFTLIFRALSIAILMCYLNVWSGVIILGLFFINFLTGLISGDDFNKSTTYAFWSLLAPVGFNRNPYYPLAYAKSPMLEDRDDFSDEDGDDDDGWMDEKDQEQLRTRSRYFLTSHVLSSAIFLGGSVVLSIILVTVYPYLRQLNSQAIFSVSQVAIIFFPVLGLCLGFSILLVRPYHRCHCSDGETPQGNIIL